MFSHCRQLADSLKYVLECGLDSGGQHQNNSLARIKTDVSHLVSTLEDVELFETYFDSSYVDRIGNLVNRMLAGEKIDYKKEIGFVGRFKNEIGEQEESSRGSVRRH
ncbi:MAG: hypothetical protein AABY22_10565 [Nanoarchaeota archaeon]